MLAQPQLQHHQHPGQGAVVAGVAAAQRLQPAGAVYYGMDESDVRRILAHPLSMIGSDGLPDDPFPHPRLPKHPRDRIEHLS